MNLAELESDMDALDQMRDEEQQLQLAVEAAQVLLTHAPARHIRVLTDLCRISDFVRWPTEERN